MTVYRLHHLKRDDGIQPKAEVLSAVELTNSTLHCIAAISNFTGKYLILIIIGQAHDKTI